jgi:hypothetical protein
MIISSAVPKDALKYIKKKAFKLHNTMAKLKKIYKGSENADVQLLADKLYSLKAKNIYEYKDIISKIKKIFSSIVKSNKYFSEI